MDGQREMILPIPKPRELEIRYYQREAIDAIYDYFQRKNGNPLVSMATGTGKAYVIAKLCQEALGQWPDTGIINVTSVKELVSQNYAEMIELWPHAPASIYSAGLGKKDLSGKIIFAGIQSIYKQAYKIPRRIDLVIVDECQDISEEDGTMFRQFINDLKICNEHVKVLGLSATVFRLSQGLLTDGKNAMFDEVVYEYGMLQAINDGYLCPLISKSMATQYDVSHVGTSKGEYKAGELERAVDKDELTVAVVDELMRYGHDRRCWLVFCSGISHAGHVRDEVRSRGVSCEMVTGKTPKEERDAIFMRYKRGEIRCVTNVGVMTKGTNIPQLDLISFLRPTKSAGLFVQMAGRGTRLSPGKTNCLLLDHAGLLNLHGPVDMIRPKRKGEKQEGEAPVKVCPKCSTICYAGFLECPECGFEFEINKTEIDAKAASDAALSTQLRTEKYPVSSVKYFLHKKEGKPDSMRVDYMCGLMVFRDWICVGHSGKAREKACRWWVERSGTTPPTNADNALSRTDELKTPKMVEVRKVGKFFEIVGVEL